MVLLERDPVLASLRQYAHEAGQGEGRLVLIGGEAGVGKSVLVERFQRDLPDARWAWGACDGLSTPRPLAPLFDLARDLGGALEDLCRGRPERDELFAALLTQVTGDDRLDVIVIEDIHWADEATLDLIRFLTRRIRAAPVLVIATYRDDWLTPSSPLRLALGDLAARRWTRRLELPPLSVEAVRTMAAGTDLDADQLYQLAGSRVPDGSATRPGRYSRRPRSWACGSTRACSPIGKLRWTNSARPDYWSMRESACAFGTRSPGWRSRRRSPPTGRR
jgi:predicted ATPase